MQRYIDTFFSGFTGYWNYLMDEVTQPNLHNYFYWLVALSILVWGLEIILPWRRNQSIFRRDFWMDGFYMFFNFFLFSLVGYNAISNVGVELFNDFLGVFGVTNLAAIELESWSRWAQLLALFIIADFVQWNIHRLLHRVPFLWEFHKVHHSVKEMGFAAHLRFHWMETVVYKTLQYIPLAMIGFSIQDFFLVHITALFIGHINHANLGWDYGPLKYILNNPKMHIWHHAKELPKEHKYGMNYGLTFSFWDYIFGTAYIPKNGKDIELGFPDEKEFPKSFWKQILYPFLKK
ncbi:MAG: sterol desaturase/sphingolipid hydroxylase (fatty acid hydroxylase superfamily) [Sphingobacteriales bacterium]|jgi:sterol desaturase/sphingolipid hydroxylase (fatty acid hydroxylase superfamily)